MKYNVCIGLKKSLSVSIRTQAFVADKHTTSHPDVANIRGGNKFHFKIKTVWQNKFYQRLYSYLK